MCYGNGVALSGLEEVFRALETQDCAEIVLDDLPPATSASELGKLAAARSDGKYLARCGAFSALIDRATAEELRRAGVRFVGHLQPDPGGTA